MKWTKRSETDSTNLHMYFDERSPLLFITDSQEREIY